MGKDKFENEDLIKYGWEQDIWFHVDNLSSAHVYLRMGEGQEWDKLPEDLLIDLAQLTKANSIEGCKKDNITVIYTPWSNLKKTKGMETGQVTFFKDKMVKKIHVQKKNPEILKRLNKTREERMPDLAQEKIDQLRLSQRKSKEEDKKQRQLLARLEEAKREQERQRSYQDVMASKHMKTNLEMSANIDEKKHVQDVEEDFM